MTESTAMNDFLASHCSWSSADKTSCSVPVISTIANEVSNLDRGNEKHKT
jgi:hypothetical protein